jgi:serine/threonine protein kinase/tetratricopeptide (TPR) repeat protein
MGVVWRGRHIGRDVPVAVKVMNLEKAGNPLVRAAFRNEVRAAARLAHRSIVTLFDQGLVSESAARSSQGELAAGSPYLAMELVEGGTLASLAPPLQWRETHAMLVAILDALAHAHAHGLIHRDLKPANILLRRPNDVTGGIALTDFGIAHAVGAETTDDRRRGRMTGTLRYMAPEQIAGNWRDEGPWTDLYALGTITYRLVCGVHPFGQAEGDELIHCQLHAPAPRVPPSQWFPEGLSGWISRLLAKRPANRFERAADAAWALERLPEPLEEGPSQPPSHAPTTEPTAELTPTATGRTLSTALFRSRSQMGNNTIAEEELSERPELPPMPATWADDTEDDERTLLGAGLGLYGLRPIPMVARTAERDLLWTRLAEVADRGCRAVALCGVSGNGKSRVVESIAVRAHEVGAASVLRATHSPINGPTDGIAPMIARSLGCDGLHRAAVEKRCRRFIAETPLAGDAEVAIASLAELVCPDSISSVRLATPLERYRAARHVLARLAKRRPVIMWLEDVQWGSDALGLVKFLLESDRGPVPTGPLPVLVLLTLREDLLDDRPWAQTQLSELLALDGSERLDISPLSTADHERLVKQLLGLSGALAARVAARTRGNPLFAVQLVGDWVARGLLEPGEEGFVLAPGNEVPLPDDIHEVWNDRAQRIVGRLPDPDAGSSALELAAALGQDIQDEEWQLACAEADIEIPPPLVEHLCADDLIVATDAGWSFSHPLFRESLERNARETGRWPDHHRACVAMLRHRYDEDEVSGRIGLHLIEGGDHEDALDPLLSGAEAYRLTCDFHRAYRLYAARERAMGLLDLGKSDPRWGDCWVRWGRALATQGDFAHALSLADRAAAAAAEHDWPAVAAWADNVRGYVALGKGDLDLGREVFERSLERFRSTNDERGLADCLSGLASVCSWRCEMEDATEYYEEAFRLRKKSRDLYELGVVLRGLGNIHTGLGEMDRAGERLQRALACFEADGSRVNVAKCLNDLGEVARKQGLLERAEELYRRSAELFESLGCDDTSTPEYNLGVVLLQREDYEAAEAVFARELARLEGSAHIDRVWLHAGMLPCAAVRKDWDAWDLHWARVQELIGSIVDEDLGELTELAGELAAEAGASERSKQAYAFARAQWQQMKRDDRVATIDEAEPSTSDD